MQRWDEVEDFLLAEASADLTDGPDVRPCLVAFAGDEPLLIAFLRSFAKGAYDGPIIELLALTAPLGADRIALSIAGRAWSLDDPVPPVLPDVGDLRQRVVSLHCVDGAGKSVIVTNALHPFDQTADGLRWGSPLRNDDVAGWLVGTLKLAVERRGQLVAGTAEMRRQARRCVELGHLLAFADAGAERLGLEDGALLG